jgi:hypothetical protein
MIRKTLLPYLLSALAGICFVQGIVIITNEGDGENAPIRSDSGDTGTFTK